MDKFKKYARGLISRVSEKSARSFQMVPREHVPPQPPLYMSNGAKNWQVCRTKHIATVLMWIDK